MATVATFTSATIDATGTRLVVIQTLPDSIKWGAITTLPDDLTVGNVPQETKVTLDADAMKAEGDVLTMPYDLDPAVRFGQRPTIKADQGDGEDDAGNLTAALMDESVTNQSQIGRPRPRNRGRARGR